MKHASRLACLLLGGLALLVPAGAGAGPDAATVATAPAFKVLVLTEGNTNIGGAGLGAAARWGSASTPQFDVDQVKQSANGFTARHLSKYNVVVFLNNGAGDVLDAEEQAAFEAYFRGGGGFVGIGSAIETNAGWQFLTDILGARASGKLGPQAATIKVADRVHDAQQEPARVLELGGHATTTSRRTSAASATCWRPSATRPSTRPATARRSPLSPAGRWAPTTPSPGARTTRAAARSTRTRASRRSTRPAARPYDDANLQKLLGGALKWAAGQSDPTYSDCGATVRANYQQSFVAAPPNLSEPIGFDVLPDGSGRVIQTDRRGGVRLHDPATNATTLLAQVPVYIANEDGMYGPEVDNNFNTNKWVYLFYSPPTVEDVKFADGTLHTVTTPLNDPATPQNEQNAPNFAADPERVGSLHRLLPALAVQVRRRERRHAGPPRPRDRAADSPRPEQPRRLLSRRR